MSRPVFFAQPHIRDVQAALGHANLKNTERYLPLVVNDLRDAMAGRTYRNADQVAMEG